MKAFGSPLSPVLADTICPNCHGVLIQGPQQYLCRGCDHSFPVIGNIPILLKKDHQIVFEAPSPNIELRLKSTLFFLRPICDLTFPSASKTNLRLLRTLLHSDSLILFVGGGTEHQGLFVKELGDRLLKKAVNLDVAPGKNVDLVADAHDIPFPDNYFEGVICQVVLEHTRDSDRVVAELHRVLKPGGIVYAEAPFLQPVHMTSDFRRFTLLGLETLFADFERIKSGVNGGIASALVLIAVQFFSTTLSFNLTMLYRFWRLLFRVLFFPFKFMDALLVRYSTTPLASSENFFLGRKV